MLTPSPVAAPDRLETLDVLRGFALLGILAMNIRAMAGPFGSYMYPLGLYEYDGASRAGFLLTSTVFDLKMMGLFSMLFGVSVLLYAAKSRGGATTRALWFRRMFWLLLIGLAHAYLVWNGDILVPYALCGLLLIWWVRRLSPAWLLVIAAALLSVGAGLSVMHGLTWDNMSEAQRADELAMWMPSAAELQRQLDGMRGGYLDVVAFRAADTLLFQTLYFAVFFFWRCSGMMLIGMALFKAGFLDGRRATGTYALVAATALPLGLVLAGIGAARLEQISFSMPERTLVDLWNYGGSILASIGYAAALILLVKQNRLPGVRRTLAAVGQMALTNYLLHSLITSVIFLGWGFGLAGRLDYGSQLLVVVAIWIAQLAFSRAWLARFRFGPVEWLWRSLTYWQPQPIRREPVLAGAA